MVHIIRKTTLVFLLTAFSFGITHAQDTGVAGTQTAEELVAGNVDAIGGEENMSAISTLTFKGEIHMPAMDMRMPITVYQKRPGKMRSEIYVPNAGSTIISGFDGETAWMVNPMAGPDPMTLEGEQAEQILRQADIDPPFVNYVEKGHSIEYVGDEEVDGRLNHKVKLTRPDSSEAVYYLDNETMLINQIDARGMNPMTNQPGSVKTVFSDYRDVGGIKMPFSMTIYLGDQLFQEMTLESVDANETIQDDRFTIPESGGDPGNF